MPEERAIGAGAGAGAALGAVTGMSVMTGALTGTAAGALTGVLTDQNQVNPGKPAWKQGSAGTTAAAAPHAASNSTTVVSLQQQRNRLGYAAGSTDCLIGPRTANAIKQYQRDHNLLSDGRATPELANHLQSLGRPLAHNPG